ncbi:sce7726 family protein [Aeromicrobium ginsengisoli]|uniref:Sce7726 family protein n=1 Tax=Aeromicrobium ginsengisoli TaxID=363867 RepID=A0A5M4F9P3_9ACTN|nr:sce7726 family protein [Aeromicrobium ginsengisoli]KAA1395113.1 sce7726 family protein [Aeromicrobium ginsengisoli]
MRAGEITGAVAAHVRASDANHPSILVPEVRIEPSNVRIDLLMIGRTLSGWEIKSDFDRLIRLPRQVTGYNSVLEYANLVVGTKHLEVAGDLIPDWWALWLARPAGPGFKITCRRAGRLNPTIDPLAVARFLSRWEVTQELNARGERGLSHLEVRELRALLVEKVGPRELLRIARSRMVQRQDWSSRALVQSW